MLKYEILENGRIRALISFNGVVAGGGDLGGFIAAEHNLSQYGNAWVYRDARVAENARVSGYAQVASLCSVTPLVISGLYYDITKTDTHLKVGCQSHTFKEWRQFTLAEVRLMDGTRAVDFYNKTLIPLMDALCLN